MLIDEPNALQADPIALMIGALNGNKRADVRLQQGVYQIGHFGGGNYLRGYEEYPRLGEFGSYGVCDGVENLLEKIAILQDPKRRFVVTLTSVRRANEPSEGGWRWHKWGEYIGKHEPQCEYLYDEVGIDEVFVYQVYEKIGA